MAQTAGVALLIAQRYHLAACYLILSDSSAVYSYVVHYDPRTFEWHNRFSNGMERQASRYALDDVRINLSSKLISYLNKHIKKHEDGPNYPYELPVGVP